MQHRRPDLICLSHLRWRFVFQRPQHLLSRFARDRRVFFFEEPRWSADKDRLEVEQTESGVVVATPWLEGSAERPDADAVQRRLLNELRAEHGIDECVLWYYTPRALLFTRQVRAAATVYDCMDELSAFAGAPADLVDLEAELLARADLVFTGGQSLYQAKRTRHPRVYAFPSSVDVQHFRAARELGNEPADHADVPRPRIGFYGVIDERMDLDLIAAVARARPQWQVVLVGPVVKIDEASLPREPNIHYLGQKGYEELPAYLAGWDVAFMPFALNEATRFISPTKTLEYLAAGKPVVSTPIRDVVHPYGDEGLVEIARTPDEFVDAIEGALTAAPNGRLSRADRFIAHTSWERTFARMRELVDPTVDAATGRETSVRVEERGFDYLVVGAGFAGSVVAERLASQLGKRVLVVERRNHIGGNAFDHYDEAGILVHRYGPHIFHTNSADVFDYLSQFTEWRPYEHRVLASVDGRLVPFPINLDTINELYGTGLTSTELADFLESVAEPVDRPRTSEDAVISKVGRELYMKFFRNYTRKQWSLDPSELDASVAARVPARLNRDDRYFTDTFQAMPRHGYTALFERMVAHPNIKVMLNTDFREVESLVPYAEMVYSGPIDEFFDCRFGRLPYRSLEFRFETMDESVHQPAAVVNYPNEHAYTRATEFKYLTGQVHPKTTLVYEYPTDEGDPYYPVPRPENAELYKRYKALADATPGVHFVGRLATYRYYNMDQVVAQALALYTRLASGRISEEHELIEPLEQPARTVGGNGVHSRPHRR